MSMCCVVSNSWAMSHRHVKILEPLLQSRLRRVLKINWQRKVLTLDVRELAEESTKAEVSKRQLKRAGQVRCTADGQLRE